MPFATAPDGTRLAWEALGEGPPVLLVAGLALNTFPWWRVAGWLSESHEVITYWNRGTGRSEPLLGELSVGQLVSDAAAVVEAAGHRAVHVVGSSLGGVVAQEFAASNPDATTSLTLMCTLAGGEHALRPGRRVRDVLTANYPDGAAMIEACVDVLYSQTTQDEHPDRIQEDVANAPALPPNEVWRAQYAAAASHDTWARLPSIAVPAMVVSGTDDRVVPPGNSEVIAGRLPSGRLELIKDAGHRLDSEAPSYLRDLLLGFLSGEAGGRPRRQRARR